MPTVTFHGASDDLIEVHGIPGGDEFNARFKDGDKDCADAFIVGGKIRVRAFYDGCWSFAVGQVDEEISLPDWPIRITQSEICEYSTEVAIDVPDGTAVFREA